MPAAELLQFEVIRTIAASLISMSIVLLWLLAMTGKQGVSGQAGSAKLE